MITELFLCLTNNSLCNHFLLWGGGERRARGRVGYKGRGRGGEWLPVIQYNPESKYKQSDIKENFNFASINECKIKSNDKKLIGTTKNYSSALRNYNCVLLYLKVTDR